MQLKKLFYARRPAAALRWPRLRPGEAVAPMSFLTLMAEYEAPPAVRARIEALLAAKARTRELGKAPLRNGRRGRAAGRKAMAGAGRMAASQFGDGNSGGP